MWPRTLSKSTGMDEAQFTKAFIKAIQNDAVVAALQKCFTSQLMAEIKDLKDLIKEKDRKIQVLEKRIDDLEDKADAQEQYSRRNSLRICGVEEKEFENPAEVTMNLLKDELGLEIQPSTVDRIHRVGRKREQEKGRPILIKFATYQERDKVYRARTKLKNYQTSRVFINEDLTRPRVQLLYEARQLKKTKQILDCWTHDGQVLIKNGHGRVCHINSKKDLRDKL